ncbi:MAG: hypothetical protein II517_03795 [Ruminococcus sp.]|nr:hypothetical protein [Ruminococcus sp.]
MKTTTHSHKHYTSEHNAPKASRKSRRVVKAASAGFAAVLAAAAFIVPTTTMAPGVEAFADSRRASYSVGDIDKFSSVIKGETTPAPAAKAATDKKTAAPAADTKKAATEKQTAKQAAKQTDKSASSATSTAASSSSAAETKKATAKAVAESKSPSSTITKEMESYSSYYDEESYSYDDYDYGYTDSYDDSSYTYSYDDEDDDYGYEESYSYSGSSSYSSSSNALLSIANPDYSYTAKHVSLSSYDRAKLERLVMGEAGTMGYTGCAVVAQAIRDSMNRSHTSSIDAIIREYQYFGSTNVQPNADVKNAVSFIFDQDGIAVQHRVMCFYIGYSAWHETQTFLCEIGGVRFFDLNVA